MAFGDLALLADVKAWLGIPATNTTNDAKTSRLISAASGQIRTYTNRYGFWPQNYTEARDGNGNNRMVLKNWPVNSVTSVSVSGQAVQAGTYPSASDQTCGWFLSQYDGNPPGNAQELELYGFWFQRGKQNVQVAYNAGYQRVETLAVPAGGVYVAQAPNGPWMVDGGVVYAGTLVPLVLVTGVPIVGQYAVVNGVYAFSAADQGALVEATYGFVPSDLYQACIDLVDYRYAQQGRAGLRSKGLGTQESVSYDTSGMPGIVASTLAGYVSPLIML